MTTPRMIGRERETRLLRTAVTAAPSLVLVVGEAGTGKSRLVAEVARDHPARWLTGQCHPVQDETPLTPVLEALAPVSDQQPGAGTPWRGALVPGMRHSVFARTRELLASLGPTVLVVEDLHWADPGTLQLLRFLASRLPREVRVVATYRPEDTLVAGEITALAGCVPPGTRTTEVRLHPLAPHAVREFAAQMLGVDELPDGLARELFERTGGLPFVLEEFLRDVAIGADGSLAPVARALAETRAPVALRAAVAIKLEQLPEACRRVVWATAVLDAPSPDALIGAVAEVGAAELADAVDAALARALLGESRPGLYDLRHALGQRAVYETIPADELRRLHRRAAEAVGSRDPGAHARIAAHARRGGLVGTWLTEAELAAAQLVECGKADRAVEQLLEMLRFEGLAWADRARLATRLGHAAVESAQWDEAVVAMRMVLDELVVASGDRGSLRLALGLVLHDRAGEFAAARRELAAAVEELGGDPIAAALAMSTLAVPTSGAEEIAEHRAWMHRALRLLGEPTQSAWPAAAGASPLAVRRSGASARRDGVGYADVREGGRSGIAGVRDGSTDDAASGRTRVVGGSVAGDVVRPRDGAGESAGVGIEGPPGVTGVRGGGAPGASGGRSGGAVGTSSARRAGEAGGVAGVADARRSRRVDAVAGGGVRRDAAAGDAGRRQIASVGGVDVPVAGSAGDGDVRGSRSAGDGDVRSKGLAGGGSGRDGGAAVRGVWRNRGRLLLAAGDLAGDDGTADAARGLLWLGHDRRSRELPAGVGTRLWQAWLAGQWEELPERLLRARSETASAPLVRAEVELVTGRLHLVRGDLSAAMEVLESVRGELPVRAAALATIGRMQLALGQTDAAVEAVEDFVSVVRRKDGWAWAGELVATTCVAWDRSERRPDALGLLQEFDAGLVGRDAPASVAASKLARAFLSIGDTADRERTAHRGDREPGGECGGGRGEGRGSGQAGSGNASRASTGLHPSTTSPRPTSPSGAGEAAVRPSADWFEMAAAAYRAIGRPYDECCALEGRARRALELGDAQELVALEARYEKLGARWDARRCREALREAGVAVTSRRGRRGYGNALSPREHEVARLAARGLSNNRIAAELSLSVSTVEDHLSRAMRKLKIRSRRDLGPLIAP
ncbi:LuxR family transcriptional regulator [Kribbella flavida]|uniref:LuxR family transcriptional regulator n=1 Tax=Kribbella flavida TaxID=182640 RepID=UPI0013053AB9|nr:LuxR family transcriptional regulator [Kribbella flavida]